MVTRNSLLATITIVLPELFYTGCSFCRLIRLPEYWQTLVSSGKPDQWVSHCYAIECDRSFCCALFCLFMTHVSRCPISLRAERPIHTSANAECVNKDQACTVYYRSPVNEPNKHIRALNCLKTEFIPGFMTVTSGEVGQYDYLTAFLFWGQCSCFN
jgi:hypothetical protein